jgi:hypothetical protein
MRQQAAGEAMNYFTKGAETNMLVLHPAINELIKELEKFSKNRKPRPPFWQNVCLSLINKLKEGLKARIDLKDYYEQQKH